MSWSEFEYSVSNGQPLTLYEFSRENKVFWRYTNADKSLTFNNTLFIATAISDSGQTAGTGDNMTITAPSDNPVVQMYRGMPPSSSVTLRIYRLHFNDQAQEMQVVWVGKISDVKRQKTDRANIISVSLASTFSRMGLRMTWERGCNRSIFDHNCKLNKKDYAITHLTISGLDGASITVNLPSNIPGAWLNAGFIEWDNGGVTERRHISSQNNNTLLLLGGTHGLSISLSITAYPGCQRNIDACAAFNNVLNYGGVPQLPGRSPFDGTRIF